jgi:hypothetical protein
MMAMREVTRCGLHRPSRGVRTARRHAARRCLARMSLAAKGFFDAARTGTARPFG